MVPARARARRAAHASRSTRAPSHSGGASSGGEQGETWAYYSTRNRLWLLERQRGARAARREAVRTSVRARVRAVRPARRAVARAKLAGVRDWSAASHGAWPVAR